MTYIFNAIMYQNTTKDDVTKITNKYFDSNILKTKSLNLADNII